MTTRNEITAWLRDGLGRTADPFLAAEGCRRPKGSLHYSRTYELSLQRIVFAFDLHPRYEAGADAHLLPSTSIAMAGLNSLALEMVDGNASLIGGGEVTLGQPFDAAIPVEHQVRWFIQGADSVDSCLRSVVDSLKRWVIPFLNEYGTPDAIVRGYERGDSRILVTRHFFIYVAAAMLTQGRPGRAMEVLEQNLGRPGSRRRYASAFEFVSARQG